MSVVFSHIKYHGIVSRGHDAVARTDDTPPAAPESAPALAPANPEMENPVFTTSLSGGGCSIGSNGDHADITLLALVVLSIVYLILLRLGTVRALKSAFLILLSTCLATGPTLADVNAGLYLGLGAGTSVLEPQVSGGVITSRDNSDSARHALLGYQINRTLAVEFEHADLGGATLAPLGTISYADWNVAGLYHFGGAPRPMTGQRFSLFGKLGVGKISSTSNITIQRGHDMHWLAGAGVQMALTRDLSLRAEAVNYDKDARRIGLGVTYSFGRKPDRKTATVAAAPQPMDETRLAGTVVEGMPVSAKGKDTDPETETETGTRSVPDLVVFAPKSSADVVAKTVAESAPDTAPDNAPESNTESISKIKPEPEPEPEFNTASDNLPVTQSVAEYLQGRNSDPATYTASKTITRTNADAAPVKMRGTATAIYDWQQSFDLLGSGRSTTPVVPYAYGVQITSTPRVRQLDLSPVQFAFDSSTVSLQDQQRLQPLVDYLKQSPKARVTLTGHTDSVGSQAYNQALSIRRAQALRRFLLDKGINGKAVLVQGMGEKNPVKTNTTSRGRNSNRRVEIQVDD